MFSFFNVLAENFLLIFLFIFIGHLFNRIFLGFKNCLSLNLILFDLTIGFLLFGSTTSYLVASFYTINIFILMLLILLIYSAKSNLEFKEKLICNSDLNTRDIIILPVFLTIATLFCFYKFYNESLETYCINHYIDISYYAKLSEYLTLNGYENPDINFTQKNGYCIPYHYFESWLVIGFNYFFKTKDYYQIILSNLYPINLFIYFFSVYVFLNSFLKDIIKKADIRFYLFIFVLLTLFLTDLKHINLIKSELREYPNIPYFDIAKKQTHGFYLNFKILHLSPLIVFLFICLHFKMFYLSLVNILLIFVLYPTNGFILLITFNIYCIYLFKFNHKKLNLCYKTYLMILLTSTIFIVLFFIFYKLFGKAQTNNLAYTSFNLIEKINIKYLKNLLINTSIYSLYSFIEYSHLVLLSIFLFFTNNNLRHFTYLIYFTVISIFFTILFYLMLDFIEIYHHTMIILYKIIFSFIVTYTFFNSQKTFIKITILFVIFISILNSIDFFMYKNSKYFGIDKELFTKIQTNMKKLNPIGIVLPLDSLLEKKNFYSSYYGYGFFLNPILNSKFHGVLNLTEIPNSIYKSRNYSYYDYALENTLFKFYQKNPSVEKDIALLNYIKVNNIEWIITSNSTALPPNLRPLVTQMIEIPNYNQKIYILKQDR